MVRQISDRPAVAAVDLERVDIPQNSDGVMKFDDVEIARDINVDLSANEIIVQESGVYEVRLTHSFTNFVDKAELELNILVDGLSPAPYTKAHTMSATGDTEKDFVQICFVEKLEKGYALSGSIINNSGGSLLTDTYHVNRFEVKQL